MTQMEITLVQLDQGLTEQSPLICLRVKRLCALTSQEARKAFKGTQFKDQVTLSFRQVLILPLSFPESKSHPKNEAPRAQHLRKCSLGAPVRLSRLSV